MKGGFDATRADAPGGGDARGRRADGASVPQWPAFPDSAHALSRLAARYKLIILSNVDRASFAGSILRLSVVFDGIVTA